MGCGARLFQRGLKRRLQAASAATVAGSRLFQSRLLRAKMSPNWWDFRNWSMTGAKSNRAPLTGDPACD